MLIWSGKNYGHGQGKSGNLILHKEWEPCESSVAGSAGLSVEPLLFSG